MFLSVTLYFVSLLRFSRTEANGNLGDSFGHISWNVRIIERYLEIEETGLDECAQECMRRKRCVSINYCDVMNYCELCYVGKFNGTLYTDSEQMDIFVHSDISTWDRSLLKQCRSNNCGINRRCNVTTGACEISDCGPALRINNTVILAQGHHEVGNGVIYSCEERYDMVRKNGDIVPEGYSILKCSSYGKWEEINFECIDPFEGCLPYKNQCFKFFSEKVDWYNAVENCRKIRGELAEIKDESVDKFLSNAAKTRGTNYWIGGTDKDIEGTWVWISTGENQVYQNWDTKYNQPNDAGDAGGEDCIVFFLTSTGWHDAPCSWKYKYICQIQLNY